MSNRWIPLGICFIFLLVGMCMTAVVALGAPPQDLPILSTPPHDVAAGRNASLNDLAQFAWQEFLALNWQASMTSERATPDPAWTYSKGYQPYPKNLLVWQTYTQTTELRPNSPLTKSWSALGTPATTP